MEDFTLNFILKQHTPLIHFQPKQSGATLRATEVKAKLDRYLIEQVFNNDLQRIIPFLVGADIPKAEELLKELPYQWSFEKRLAFDYALRITPGADVKGFHQLTISQKKNKYETIEDKFPVILGNMGGKDTESELKNFSYYESIILNVRSFHSQLLAALKTALPKFVACENFGNRSGKGFGSFTCVQGENEVLAKIPYDYKFTCNVVQHRTEKAEPQNEFEKMRSLFSILDVFYKTLRAGINWEHKRFYFKSLVYLYASTVLEESWDKKSIKNYYINDQTPNSGIDHKDFLGFSSIEEWMFGENKTRINMKITKESAEIQRFKSPIVFKPVRIDNDTFDVYILLQPIPKEFCKAEITVKRNGTGALILRPSEKFDLYEFLKFAFETTNVLEHVKNFDKKNWECHNNDLFKYTINPIFTSIKTNLKK